MYPETLSSSDLDTLLKLNYKTLSDSQRKQIDLLRMICKLQNKNISESIYSKVIKNEYKTDQAMLIEAFGESHDKLAHQHERLVLIEKLMNCYFSRSTPLTDEELIDQLNNPNLEVANLYLYNFLKNLERKKYNPETWESLSTDRPFIHLINYLKHLGIYTKLKRADAHRFLLTALLNLYFDNKEHPNPKDLTVNKRLSAEDGRLPAFDQPEPIRAKPFKISDELINELVMNYGSQFDFSNNEFYQAFCEQSLKPEDEQLINRQQQLKRSLTEHYNPEYPDDIDKNFIGSELKALMNANQNWAALTNTILSLDQNKQQELLKSAYKLNAFQPIQKPLQEVIFIDQAINQTSIESNIYSRTELFLLIAIEHKETESIPIEHLIEVKKQHLPDANGFVTLWFKHPESDRLNSKKALELIHSQIPFCAEEQQRGFYLELMKRSLKNGWNEVYSGAEQHINPLNIKEYLELLNNLPTGEEPYTVELQRTANFEQNVPEGQPAPPSVYHLNINNLLRKSLLSEDWIKKIAKNEEHMLTFIEACELKDEIRQVVDGLLNNNIPMTPAISRAIQQKCDDSQKKALRDKAISRHTETNFKEVLQTFDFGNKSHTKIQEAVTGNNLPYLNYLLEINNQNTRLVSAILNNRPNGISLIQHALNHQNYPMIYTLIAQNHGALRDDLLNLQKPGNINAQTPDFKNFKVVLGVFQKIDELYQRKSAIDSNDATKGRAIDDIKNQFIASVKTLSQDNNFRQFSASMKQSIDHNKSSLMHHRGSKGILASIISILNKLHMFTKEKWKPQTLSWKIAEQARDVIQKPQALDDSKLFKP